MKFWKIIICLLCALAIMLVVSVGPAFAEEEKEEAKIANPFFIEGIKIEVRSGAENLFELENFVPRLERCIVIIKECCPKINLISISGHFPKGGDQRVVIYFEKEIDSKRTILEAFDGGSTEVLKALAEALKKAAQHAWDACSKEEQAFYITKKRVQ